jgi:hypothetical protein
MFFKRGFWNNQLTGIHWYYTTPSELAKNRVMNLGYEDLCYSLLNYNIWIFVRKAFEMWIIDQYVCPVKTDCGIQTIQTINCYQSQLIYWNIVANNPYQLIIDISDSFDILIFRSVIILPDIRISILLKYYLKAHVKGWTKSRLWPINIIYV